MYEVRLDILKLTKLENNRKRNLVTMFKAANGGRDEQERQETYARKLRHKIREKKTRDLCTVLDLRLREWYLRSKEMRTK